MRTITLEVLNESALQILQEMEKLKIVRLWKNKKETRNSKTTSFKAVSLNTEGFRFNRDEANER
jgi:hypothetical protein